MIRPLGIVSQHRLFGFLARKLADQLPSSGRVRLLDVGCGERPYERLLRKLIDGPLRTLEYTGVDFYNAKADAQVDLNRSELPFGDASYDVILSTEVLEHLHNPLFALGEMRRVLRPNGLLLLTTPFAFYVHEKEHDYYRYTYHLYRLWFAKDEILEEVISNSILSFPLYAMYYALRFPSLGMISFLQKPLDWLALRFFGDRWHTYSCYMDSGFLVRINGSSATQPP